MKDLQLKTESRKSSLGNTEAKNYVNGASRKVKKFNLTVPQIDSKIQDLTTKIETLTGPENKKKRSNMYQMLAKLRKAHAEPANFTIDKKEEDRRIQDRKKRIQKKIELKQQKLEAKRQAKLAEWKKLKNAQRDRRKHCLYCKKYGHTFNDCTEREKNGISANVCYNCGSPDCNIKICPKPKRDGMNKFATCFICNEQGHLSKDCPNNTNGIYPYGGGCYFCGSKMHKKADCPDKGKYNNKRALPARKDKVESKNKDAMQEEVYDNPDENINVELQEEY